MDWKRLVRILSLVGLYALLVYGGQILSEWALDHIGMEVRPSTQATVHVMVMIAAGLYVLLLALPFMPGVEIGLGLMVVLGPSICLLVYLGTVVALSLAFTVGRMVPPATLAALFRGLGLHKTCTMVAALAPLSGEQRLAFLLSRAPAGSLGFLLRHRHIALAVLFNLPGNVLIGGGGGIALAVGLSRIFTFPGFLLTAALAVSPVPLLYFLTDGFRSTNWLQ